MFDTFEPHIDSSLSALGNTSNSLGNNSVNPLQPDLSGFGSHQLLALADQKFIDTWHNKINPVQVSINTYDSVLGSGNGLTGRYFNNADFTDLGLIRTDTKVNFNWGNGSPYPSIAPDTFSVRWNGQVQSLYSENYTFSTQSDDGVKLWVNGQLLIDKWQNQSTKEYSGKITLEAGKLYDIQLDYYENGGQAVSNLLWSSKSQVKQIIPTSQLYSTLPTPIATGTGNGLTSRYYNNTNFTDLGLIRTDAQINFDWGNGSPDINIDKDTFSVISSGKIQPLYNEKYNFYTQSDDGGKLFINGQPIIDEWKDHSVKEHKGTITLEAGKLYDIEYKYYENSGQAVSKLLWSSDSQVKEIIPTSQLYSTLPTPYQTGFGTGLRGEYFDNKDLTNSKLVRTDATIDFNWGKGSPDPVIGKDTFSATWTGFVQPLYGEKYTFSTQSDDGVRVWVDDQIIIDRWQDQSTKAYSGFINLEAGKLSKIRVDYYENGGDAVSKLFWSSDSQVKQIIPTSQLYKDNNQPLIGIIDTGFAANNPDINYSRITLGKDRVDNDNNPLLAEGEGNEHGTHILGIIAATQDNDLGIDGINNDAPIWLGRAIGDGKWAESLRDYVDFEKMFGRKNGVINMSFDLTQKNADGTITTRYELTPEERSALEYARQNHILVVVAAGNNGSVMSVLGQASQEFDNIITVGAADGDNRADYSSYGNGLDILADGGTIDNPILSTVGDGLGTMTGTSVAAAKVTGAVSLIWENNSDLNYLQVKEILTSTATDLNTPGWDLETGIGLLNLEKALELSTQINGEIYNPEPILSPTTWSGEGVVIPIERAVAEQFTGNGQYYNWISYQVKPGDTLSQISLDTMGRGIYDYYMWIANRNGISNPNYIVSGQWIMIPQLTSPPQPPVIDEPPTNPEPPVPPEIITIDDNFIDIYADNSWLGHPKNPAINDNGFIKQDFEYGYLIWNGQNTIAYQFGTRNTFFIYTGNPDQTNFIDELWKVEFWDNKELAGNPKWIQFQPPGDIKFNAGLGAPSNTIGIPVDNFSGRWTRTDNFTGGLYNFISQADDGVRVYIDGVKVIDKWVAIEPWSRRDGYVLIPEGNHKVVVEYFEASGIAGQNFKWEKSNLIDNWTGDLRPVGYDGTSVHNTYVNTYQRNGDISELGYPLNNVHVWENGHTQDFDGGTDGRGAIMKSNTNDNSYWVGGQVWQKFMAVGGARYLGYPTTNYIDINGGLDNIENNGGIVQYFTGNIGIPTKIWLSKYGAHPTWGAIGGKYEALGGANSFLGFPTSQETGIGDGWVQQNFENGYMLWHPQYGAISYDTKAIDSLPPDNDNGTTDKWHVQYWNNKNLIGESVWSEYIDSSEIRFHAGNGAPLGTRGVKEDNFSVRWTTTSYFDGGLYQFLNRSDDGIRVFVDNEIVINKWRDSPFEQEYVFITVPQGYHDVRVEYFENGGIAANTLSWVQVRNTNQWIGEYFNNTSLSGSPVQTEELSSYPISSTSLQLHSNSPQNVQKYRPIDPLLGGSGFLDKNWGVGHESFIPIGNDKFSDSWLKVNYFEEPGVYEFTNLSDDGIRVWINGNLVVDRWQDQGFTTNKFLVALDQGYHEIIVEHYENVGASGIKLTWDKVAGKPALVLPFPAPNFPNSTNVNNSYAPIVIGWDQPWVAEYFNNTELSGAPVVTELVDSVIFNGQQTRSLSHGINLDWRYGSPNSKINIDNFSSRLTTHRYMTDGTYKFKLQADDGVRLYINGEKVIDRWNNPPFAVHEQEIILPKGIHTFQIEHREYGGLAYLNFDWDNYFTGLEYQVGNDSQGNINNKLLTAYQEIADDLGRNFVGVPIGAVEVEYTYPQITSPHQNLIPAVIYTSGVVQEFQGSEGKGALLNKLGTDEVSYVFGSIWELYQQGGGTEIFGYPLASQKDLGNGAYELDLANGKIFYKPGMTNATYYEYFNGSLTIPADAWRGEYYNNRTWSGDPVVVRADSNSDQNLNKDWRSASPAPGIPADNFSVRWTSYQDFDRGTYRLTGTHDDNFRVTVNGQTPINRTGVGNVKGYGIFTQPGQYLLELNYVEYGGLAVANFSHEKASDFIVGLDPNNNPNQRIIDTFLQQGGYERVGIPINDVHPWYGLVQDFRGGANGDGIIMRENNNSEPYYIYGDIWRVYLQNNNVAGLGYPTSNVFNDGHGNTAQNFGYNRITRHPDGYTFVGGYVNGYQLGGDFFRVWNQYQLGTPTSGVINYSNGITYRYFNHPTLGQVSAVQSQYGTFPLIGGIRGYYVNVAGGLGGALGAPKSAEYSWNGKTRQDFAGGYILWNGSAVGYRPDGSLLFPPTNSGGGNGGGSGSGSQLSRNEIQTILYNFFAKYGQNWADQSFDEMWDRVGGESAQFPNGNFTSGDQWQVDMPSEIFDIYKDLSNTIFGTVNSVNTGYVHDQGYYDSYGKWHAGLDIQASQGTLVKAAIGGKVAWMNGNFIGVDGDDGNHWVYGHLGTKYVKNGQRIEIGQQLARTDYENHLHLEVQHGHGYKQTLGAHTDQNWLRSVTISPIQAYWDFNKSSDNGNGGGSDPNTRFQSELNEALNRIGSSITSVVSSPKYINADQGKGWISQYRLSNGKEYFFGLQDGKSDGYWVLGDNLGEYMRRGGPYGSLGFPTNEETPFTSHTGASGIWQSFSGSNGNARIHNSWITDNGGQREYVGSVATWGSIGGLYESMGGSNSWLGTPTKAEWHSPDGKTIWSRFERGWITNNKDTNQTESFDFNSRPSWIKNAYEKEFILYSQQDLSLSPIEFESSGDTTWNISVDNLLTKYGNLIKLAALYYGVSGQAIVGIIQWEYDQNSFSRASDELAFETVQITGTWLQVGGKGFSGTGWGKMHYTTAQKLIKQNSGLFDMDDPYDNRKLARYLAAPFSAIDLIAQELRKASQAYLKYGFEIYNNPGVLATLYRIGEKDQSYEERAKSNRQNNQYPKIETGQINVNDFVFPEQKVTVMGKWVYDKVQRSDLISYQTFSGETETYNHFRPV